MQQYRDLLRYIRANGNERGDRTGTGTVSVFGYQMFFDLGMGFPLVTGKKTDIKNILHELLWFLKGDTNIKYLNDNGVNIWNEWADKNGNLGPVYGKQWRSWPAGEKLVETGIGLMSEAIVIDQIQDAINQIRNNPESRRIIVSAWNPSDISDMKLPPCHCLFQFYCTPLTDEEINTLKTVGDDCPKYKLSLQMYQRSVDTFLGLPYNIASYSILLMMIAKITNTIPYEFIWTGGDVHLYNNHVEQVSEYLKAEIHDLPHLTINGNQKEIEDFKFEDFVLENYQHGKFIKASIAV